MAWRTLIKKITDNVDYVSASTLNPILGAYTERTQWLYDQFNSHLDKSVLLAYNQPIAPSQVDGDITKGRVVYYDHVEADAGIKLARTAITYGTDYQYVAADSAFTFGIVKETRSVDGVEEADIYTFGLIEGISAATIFDDSVSMLGYTGGPVYLSSLDSGRIVTSPAGLAIYIGYITKVYGGLVDIFLNPTFDAAGGFFHNYIFNLLDRPATDTSTGSMVNDYTKLGWIDISKNDYEANGISLPNAPYEAPTFFYNIPGAGGPTGPDGLDADVYITEQERTEAKRLRSLLPPNPNAYTVFSVNGVSQLSVMQCPGITGAGATGSVGEAQDGTYYINESGVWWYGPNAPYAADLSNCIRVRSVKATNKFYIEKEALNYESVNSPFAVGDEITFTEFTSERDSANCSYASASGPTGPINIIAGYVGYTGPSGPLGPTGITDGEIWFTLKDGPTGAAITFNTDIVPIVYIPWKSEYWSWAKGSPALRSKMELRFVKINPELSDSLVTSLDVHTDSKNFLKVVDGSNPMMDQTKGDLLLKYNLEIEPSTEGVTLVNNVVLPNTGTAVKAIAQSTTHAGGAIDIQYGPVVSKITGYGAAAVSANETTGEYNISVSNGLLGGSVMVIEPEAPYEYQGLHSFLNLKHNVYPTGMKGKIALPASIPTGIPLNLHFTGFGSTGPSSGSTVTLQCEYCVSAPGVTIIGSPVQPVPLIYTLTWGTYSAGIVRVFNNVFTIPAIRLVSQGILNFRITRKAPATGTDYTGDLGILNTSWSIGNNIY